MDARATYSDVDGDVELSEGTHAFRADFFFAFFCFFVCLFQSPIDPSVA